MSEERCLLCNVTGAHSELCINFQSVRDNSKRLRDALIALIDVSWDGRGHCPICEATPHSRHCEFRAAQIAVGRLKVEEKR